MFDIQPVRITDRVNLPRLSRLEKEFFFIGMLVKIIPTTNRFPGFVNLQLHFILIHIHNSTTIGEIESLIKLISILNLSISS